MKTDRSLEEVWEWKEKRYQALKALSPETRRAQAQKEFEEAKKKYPFKVHRAHHRAAA